MIWIALVVGVASIVILFATAPVWVPALRDPCKK